MTYTVKQGDVLTVTQEYPDNYFDGLFCDPPYALISLNKPRPDMRNYNNGKGNPYCSQQARSGFMGKEWDKEIPRVEVWTEILRTMKPGAFGLVFGGTRTWHRLAVALEDAGFEIRDTLMWLYGSGFPKSFDISKGIDKAAGAEREVVGYKEGTIADPSTGRHDMPGKAVGVKQTKCQVGITVPATSEAKQWDGYGTALKPSWEPCLLIRKPLDGNNAQNALKHGCGGLNIDGGRVKSEHWYSKPKGKKHPLGDWPANLIEDGTLDIPHYSYCAKASSSERNAGLEGFEEKEAGCYGEFEGDGRGRQTEHTSQRNHHPTVKPLDLCQYLAKLILPPEREGDPRKLLVPFAGSGSEMIGALQAGWDEVDGIEIDPEYCEIAEARLTYWCKREKEKIPF